MGGCVPHQIEGGQVFAPSCMASQQCSSTLAAGGKGCSKEKYCHKLEQSTKLCIRHTTPLQKKAFAHKKKHKQTNPPPHPNFSFLFFVPFFCFLFLFLSFVFVLFRFFVAKKEQKTMRILFLFISTAPHSTQHTAQSTKHRAQSTHTHTHTHKYCIMKPSGPSWNTRLFRDK